MPVHTQSHRKFLIQFQNDMEFKWQKIDSRIMINFFLSRVATLPHRHMIALTDYFLTREPVYIIFRGRYLFFSWHFVILSMGRNQVNPRLLLHSRII